MRLDLGASDQSGSAASPPRWRSRGRGRRSREPRSGRTGDDDHERAAGEDLRQGGRTATATWEFTANESAGFTCKFTGHQVEPCTSPMTYAGLSKGRYTFTVYAFDASGNRDMSRARSQVRVVKKKHH